MPDAFVLINTAMGKEKEVLDDLRNIEGISMVHGTFGAYDIITKVSADETMDMRQIITEKIRKIIHVRSTLALIIIDEQEL